MNRLFRIQLIPSWQNGGKLQKITLNAILSMKFGSFWYFPLSLSLRSVIDKNAL